MVEAMKPIDMPPDTAGAATFNVPLRVSKDDLRDAVRALGDILCLDEASFLRNAVIRYALQWRPTDQFNPAWLPEIVMFDGLQSLVTGTPRRLPPPTPPQLHFEFLAWAFADRWPRQPHKDLLGRLVNGVKKRRLSALLFEMLVEQRYRLLGAEIELQDGHVSKTVTHDFDVVANGRKYSIETKTIAKTVAMPFDSNRMSVALEALHVYLASLAVPQPTPYLVTLLYRGTRDPTARALSDAMEILISKRRRADPTDEGDLVADVSTISADAFAAWKEHHMSGGRRDGVLIIRMSTDAATPGFIHVVGSSDWRLPDEIARVTREAADQPPLKQPHVVWVQVLGSTFATANANAVLSGFLRGGEIHRALATIEERQAAVIPDGGLIAYHLAGDTRADDCGDYGEAHFEFLTIERDDAVAAQHARDMRFEKHPLP